MTLPFSEARALADGARARALDLGKALSIAVVDYGGFIVLIERMDGARPMTADIALAKAYSSAVMQRPIEMLENWRNSDPVFFTQVGRMGHRPIVATKGGITIKRDDAILGGLGVSGGSPDEDQQICVDVLKAGGFDLDFPQWAGARKQCRTGARKQCRTGARKPRTDARKQAGQARGSSEDRRAGFVDLGNLALSPQCGFASVAEGGNHLTAEEQFAKLRLVADTARAIWGSAG